MNAKGAMQPSRKASLTRKNWKNSRKKNDAKEMPAGQKPVSQKDKAFKAADNTKKVRLNDDDPSKTATIGSGLGDQ